MRNLGNTKALDWVWLLLGVAITVVYVVFADPLYEALYFGSDDFADAMYDNNQYFVVALISCLCSWGVAAIYYLIIDSVSLDSFFGWFCGLIITWVIALCLTVYIPDQTFIEQDLYDYTPYLWNIGWINIGICLIIYCIASLSIKNLSKNVPNRPF